MIIPSKSTTISFIHIILHYRIICYQLTKVMRCCITPANTSNHFFKMKNCSSFSQGKINENHKRKFLLSKKSLVPLYIFGRHVSIKCIYDLQVCISTEIGNTKFCLQQFNQSKKEKFCLPKQLSLCCQAAILLVYKVQTEKLLLKVPCSLRLIHLAEGKKHK